MVNRDDEAASELQSALAIASSARVYTNLGTLRFFQGKYQEALPAMLKARDLAPSNYLYWGNLADTYRWIPGGEAQAKEAYLQAIQLGNDKLASDLGNTGLRASIAVYLAKSGNSSAAITEAARIETSSANTPGTLFKCALVYEIAGRREQALSALSSALAAGYSLREVQNEPDLVRLRSDVRYYRIIAKAQSAAPRPK